METFKSILNQKEKEEGITKSKIRMNGDKISRIFSSYVELERYSISTPCLPKRKVGKLALHM